MSDTDAWKCRRNAGAFLQQPCSREESRFRYVSGIDGGLAGNKPNADIYYSFGYVVVNANFALSGEACSIKVFT
jgi:hypothetical protein